MGDVDRFIDGFRRYQKQLYGNNERLAAKLTKGQSPKALVISCSDSRVDPALLTDCAPGDIFTVRNVANLVPPYEPDSSYHGVSAALEYAVCILEVRDIIILGHSGCGGIDGLLKAADGDLVGEFIGHWVDIAADAYARARSRVGSHNEHELRCTCEQEAILSSLANLQTFPWLKKRLDAGVLKLHGWYFILETGQLHGYSDESGGFEELVSRYSS